MESEPSLVVYRRPRCQYSLRLGRALNAARVSYQERNIWKDPQAAAFVRSVADGKETVPTVVLGDQHWVNPDPAELIAIIKAEAPHLAGVALRQPFRKTIAELLGLR